MENYEYYARLNDIQKDYVKVVVELEALKAKLRVLRCKMEESKLLYGSEVAAILDWHDVDLPENRKTGEE